MSDTSIPIPTGCRQRIWAAYSTEDDCWLAAAPALNGCIVHGETRGEAIDRLDSLIIEWFTSARKLGWPIPEDWR